MLRKTLKRRIGVVSGLISDTPNGGGGSDLRVCLWGAGANVGKRGWVVDCVEDWAARVGGGALSCKRSL